jgi:hypothetical protein
MGLITMANSYVGIYRGLIVDHGVGETTNKNPQWIAALHAEEYWDESEKVWVSYADREDTDITAYLVLAGKEQNELFHCKALEKAIGWDGQSFAALAGMDLSETRIQFTVEENDYNDNITLKVTRIDHADAEPGRSVQKLDAAAVKDLDARFASFFRKRKGETKPVKPVGKPVVPGKKIEKPKVEEPVEEPTEDAGPPSKAKAKAKPKANPPKKEKGCTQAEAWKACKEAKDKSVSDKKLAEVWLEAVETLAPDGDEDKMTPELWARVKVVVSERVTGEEVAHL